MQKEKNSILINSQLKDSSSKVIFDEPVLCAQFLRDYVNIPYMKEVRAEDIEDVSAQFVPLFAEERNADRVKKVNIRGKNPFFLVSLIEHKTEIEYNVCMQIFRYMIYIWEDYEKKMETLQKGITKRKDFKYPPILPIIYYEGRKMWTAPLDFRSRVNNGEIFEKFVPNFQYYLVPICQYENEELLEKADEISLIMLLNKLQTEEDFTELKKIPSTQLEAILRGTPKHILDRIANVMLAFLLKANVPIPEAEELVGKVREKKMGELFANVKIDIQAMRREVAKAEQKLDEAEQKLDEAEQKLDETEQKLDETEQKLDETEQKLDAAEQKLDEAEQKLDETTQKLMEADREAELERQRAEMGIRVFVESCQEFGLSETDTLTRLIAKFEFETDLAEKKMKEYWKK